MEEWEEPLHPGSLSANLSHFPPQRNPNCTFFPTYPSHLPSKHRKCPLRSFFPRRGPATFRGRSRDARPPASPPRARPRADLRCRSARVDRPPLARSSAGGTRSSAPAPLLHSPPSPRRAALLALDLRSHDALAGCGSSSSPGTNADPAGVVPASAPLYAGAVVRPSGTLKTNANAAATSLTHQPDSYTPPRRSCSRSPAARRSTTATTSRPGWEPTPGSSSHRSPSLRRAPHSCSSCSRRFSRAARGHQRARGRSAHTGVQGAIVLDTSDAAKAGSFINTEAQHAGAHAASYRGVAYQATSGGDAFGIVDRFAVLGSVTGLHNVIDTRSAVPRSCTPRTTQSCSRAPPPARSPMSTRTPRLLRGLAARRPAGPAPRARGTTQSLGGLLGLLGGTQHAERLARALRQPQSRSTSTAPTPQSPHPPGASASHAGLLSSASRRRPGVQRTAGRILARRRASGNVGVTLAGDVQALHGLASLITSLGGSFRRGLLEPKKARPAASTSRACSKESSRHSSALSAPGAQTQHDFLSWMSSAGIFASGTGIVNLRGADRARLEGPVALEGRDRQARRRTEQERAARSSRSRSPAPTPRSPRG